MRPLALASLLFALSTGTSAAAAVSRPAAVDDDLLERALFVGGAHDEGEMARMRALYHARVDPLVAVVRGQPETIAAQLLLRHLHQSYGGTQAVLRRYVYEASSVNDVLDRGEYNCVAATTLFLLAAHDAGLNVQGELFDDHARAFMAFGGRSIHIEATSPAGFDVDDWRWRWSGALQTGPLVVVFPHPVSTAELLAAVYNNAAFFGLPTPPSLGGRAVARNSGWTGLASLRQPLALSASAP